MQFKDIIGQEETKQHLIQMYRQNRLSHALLFLGKEGRGTLPLALAFVQFILCDKVNGKNNSNQSEPSLFGEDVEENNVTNEVIDDSCGICSACQKAASLMHPDIHYSYPVVTKKSGEKPLSTDYIADWRTFIKEQPYGNVYDWLQLIEAENKQGNISAHECNEIIKKLSLKSFEAEYKFLIMWMPEHLGQEGNKLLKLIEEPPPNTVFIFIAENEQLILQTILSRTQLIKIGPLKQDEISEALQQKFGMSVNQSAQVAAVSDGNFHEALNQLQNAEDNWEVLLRDWLNTIVKTGPAAQVKWIEDVSKIGREKQKQFLKYFTHMLEHALRIRVLGKNMPDIESGVNDKMAAFNDFSIRFNRLCNVSQQESIIKELDLASYHIERNANAKILFHALTIKLYHIISNKSVILVS